jgi:glyoxylase-like metal-dependent hydrolase (beta-lactamase superfamily II)
MTDQILQHVTPHVWWMPPAKPDRPALCAVVGERGTLMLDAGASDTHARLFLDALTEKNLPAPRFVALTHWHWDHTFGTAEIGVPIIAHPKTADKIWEMAGYEWDDESMAARVAQHLGIPTENGMKDIVLEVPGSKRQIRFAMPELLIETALTIDLGNVTCRIEHVGGDHAADSCVMHIVEDRVLFLGDCMYQAIFPKHYYTMDKMVPLLDKLLAYDAEQFIEGHGDKVLSREEATVITTKMRDAGRLVQEMPEADTEAVLASAAAQGFDASDEDFDFFVRTLVVGRDFS